MRELSEGSRQRIRAALAGLPPDRQEREAVLMIARDFYLYCERNLMIKDKVTGAVVPLVFNWAQQQLVERVLADLAAGRPVRYIILKARQMGISTVIEALCYWWVATHRNMTAAIVAHEKSAAANLYKMFRRFYENSHPKFQPSLKYNTKNDLTFDVEDGVKQAAIEAGEPVPGLGSEISTMVAKDDAGRSGTNHFVHGSEVAMWEGSADIVSGLMQTVPMAPNTFILLESTAKGIASYFFSEWMAAERGESQFTPFFLAWHDHADYELDAAGGGPPYSDRERALISGNPELDGGDPWCLERRGYGPERIRRKVAWRRAKLKEFSREPEKMDQEYPDNPMVAFLATGSYAFSVARLLAMQARAREWEAAHGVRYAEIVPDRGEGRSPARDRRLSFVADGPLKVWREPVKGRKYVIGADVAEGIEVSSATGKEGDYSVADVMDAVTLETVARWRGHIDPDLFGDLLFDLGMAYNSALVGVEANNHGIVTIQKLKNRFYRSLYQREPTPEEQEFGQIRTTLLGWLTNRKTKPLMVAALKGAIRDDELTDYDPVFIGEAMVYTSNDRGVYGGKEGGHDDTVMAKAIALQLADYSAYDVQYAKENVHKENNRKIRKNGSTSDQRPGGRSDAVKSARRAKRAAVRSRR